MGKKKWDNSLPSASVVWDLTRTALVLTAASRGKPGRKYNVKPMTEESLRRKHEHERNRFIRTARKHYDAWLASDDALSMPLGSARYLNFSAETQSIAQSIHLWEKAKTVIDYHHSTCHDTCRDLLHEGLLIPEMSVVMQSALDSSMSNFARVVACSPEKLIAASVEGEDVGISSFQEACSSSMSMASSSAGESFCIYPSPQKLGQSIYLLPPPTSVEDQKCIIDDLLLDTFVLANPEIFGVDRIKWLSTSKDGVKSQLPFERILQHWCVQEHISHQSIGRLLKLLHFYKPTYICYNSLPRTGRTLLAVTDSAQVKKGRKEKKKPRQMNLLEEHGREIRTLYAPGLRTSEKTAIGRYVHFGMEEAITGKSIGLLHRYHYRNLLRRVHTILPHLLPEEFLALTKPEADEPFDKESWMRWLFQERKSGDTNQEPLIFEIRINADGAQWFESSYMKGTPILGKLVAIRTLSGETRVKIPYNLGKPFVIGIYEQVTAKPPADLLLEDTIEEMKRLHPDTLKPGSPRAGASFAVEVVCFNCDAPMRADIKGIKSCTGLYGCERCRTRGIYIKKGHVQVQTQVAISRVDAVPPAGTDSSTTALMSAETSNAAGASKWIRKLVTKNKRKGGSLAISGKVKRIRLLPNESDLNSDEDSQVTTGQLGLLNNGQGSSDDSGCNIQSSSSSSSENRLMPVIDEGEIGDDDEPLDSVAEEGTSGSQQHTRMTRSRRSAFVAAQLKNRHNLAVISQRKTRAMEEDEGIVSSDEENADGPPDEPLRPSHEITIRPAAPVAAAPPLQTAEGQKASSNPSGKKQGKKKGGGGGKAEGKQPKGKKQGGSTYFPEIGAPKRYDRHWEAYIDREEPDMVNNF